MTKLGVVKEILRKSSHCVLCRLISQTLKMSIIDSSVPEQHVAGYLAEVDTSEIGLFFSMAAEYNDRLHITVEPPLMIDGWLPFAASRNSLRLFRETGELF